MLQGGAGSRLKPRLRPASCQGRRGQGGLGRSSRLWFLLGAVRRARAERALGQYAVTVQFLTQALGPGASGLRGKRPPPPVSCEW